MTPLARWGALPLLAAPLGAWALGLGDIELHSALNQPLEAEIQLVSATPEEVSELNVSLAARETFDRYGIDRPAFLNTLRFSVGKNSLGQDVIVVTSRESITEPFVTMLVEATWPRGRLLREYTVLLDPPVLLPAEPAAAATVQPAETRAPEPAQPAGPISRPPVSEAQPPAPTSAPAVSPAPALTVAPAQTPAPPSAPRAAASTPLQGAGHGPVQRGETLWGIAQRYLPAGVSMNQMMVAMYEANRGAFIGNMNILQQGVILRIPDAAELSAVAPSAATAEVQRQTDEWRGSPQQQARLRLVAPEDGGVAATRGGAQADSAAAAELGELRGEVQTLQAELEENRRLLALRDEQLQALQSQLSAANEAAALAEPSPEPQMVAEPGVDLESEVLFSDEAEPAAVAGAIPAPQAEQPEIAPPPVVTEPVAPATQVVTSEPDGPSLVSRVLGWIATPLVWIVLGVAALLGTAVWYLRHRQEDVDDLTGRWEALEAEVDDDVDVESREATERMRRQAHDDSIVVVEQLSQEAARETDFEPQAKPEPLPSRAEVEPDEQLTDETLSSQTVINLDQADPVAEADFHMAYGLYDQAAELVSKALEADPERRDLKLKLLEVFFVWGNKDAFLDAAQALRQEIGDGSDADWDKVVIMGKQICPDEALFAGAITAAAEVDLDLQSGESPALDLSLDEIGHAGVDLDLGGDEVELELEELTGEAQAVTAETPPAAVDMDLDIGDQTAAGLEAALLGEASPPADASAVTTPNLESDSTAATQESPTIESPLSPTIDSPGPEFETVSDESPTTESPTVETAGPDAPTVETPTVETSGPDAPTMETPSLETADSDAPTMETPTLETPMAGTSELPTVEQPALPSGTSETTAESTAEIDLDDLGLDVKDLDELPEDLGELPAAEDSESDTREQLAMTEDDGDLLSATGVTQVLQEDELEHVNTEVLGPDDATLLAPMDENTLTGTHVLEQPIAEDESDDTSLMKAMGDDTLGTERNASGGHAGLDLNLDDVSAALDGGATVEQPGAAAFSDVFSDQGAGTGIDLDVGADVPSTEEPTATEEMSPLDPQTMTEVGTKLDLARAYIDMGDPEGARSILEEVLDEGDAGQKEEAQSLMSALSA